MKTVQQVYNIQVEQLVERYEAHKISDENCALHIQELGLQAWINYNGLLADFRLEKMLTNIGKKNMPVVTTQKTTGVKKKVLHVATSVGSIGGHTRVILDWINNDQSAQHTVYLTDQIQEPQILLENLKDHEIIVSMTPDLIGKAKELNIFSAGFDLVILHHHPNDVVPLIAFANPSAVPVFVYNHADHVFWFGASIADLVVDFRIESLTSTFRKNDNVFVLPFLVKDVSIYNKEEKKKALGLAGESLMLLSIGAPYKFLPHDFSYIKEIIIPVLESNPTVVYYLIGPDREFVKNNISSTLPANLIPLGYINNPTSYLEACDIYVESAPMGSGLASVDVVKYDAVPLFSKCFAMEVGRTNAVSVFLSERLEEMAAVDKEDYRHKLIELINNKKQREKYLQICKEELSKMSKTPWQNKLNFLYDRVDQLTHLPVNGQENRILKIRTI